MLEEMRTPQQERSRATQARLLDATVDCLVELRLVRHHDDGHRRAGRRLPRRPAAPLPDQGDPGDGRRRAPRRPARRRDPRRGGQPAGGRTPARPGDRHARRRVHRSRSTSPPSRSGSPPAPTPSCAYALVPVEARVGREMHRLTVELLDADERRTGVRESVQATLDLMRGLGVANLLSDDAARRATLLRAVEAPPRRRDQRLKEDQWSSSPPCSPISTPSPPTSTPWSPTTRRPTGPARRRPRLDRRAPDRPSGLDRPRRAAGRDRRRRSSSPARPARRRPRPARRPGAEGFLAPPDRAAGNAGVHGRRALAEALRAAPDGQADPLVRQPHVAARRWPPPGSWRPGRTASDVADALGLAREPDRPAAARRASSASVPSGTRSWRTARPRPSTPVRVELVAPDGAPVGLRPGRRPADRVTGPALDFCLLVTQRRHRADLALVATGPVADRVAGRGAGVRRPARRQARSPRRPVMIRDRQRVRLLRRPVHRLAGDARRRRPRRADRRLPGRADHADPRPRPGPRPGARLRQDVPAPDGGQPRHSPSTRASSSSPTPAASTPPGLAAAIERTGRPARHSAPHRVRRGRRPASARTR